MDAPTYNKQVSVRCTLPIDHVGPIPGVLVGQWWKTREEVSIAGVHRPTEALIHASEDHGAYSIVIDERYDMANGLHGPADELTDKHIDYGDVLVCMGSGFARKSDQEMTTLNKGLAISCAATFDPRGADAGECWRAGRPIRLVRTLATGGYRYDGIYKVTGYESRTDMRSSFLLKWKFYLSRDDESPAPWEPIWDDSD